MFRAWTDPDEVAAWYGPEHMEAPRERIHIDLRVGGRWELTMVQRGGDGEFAIGYEILELVEPELIVLRSDPMPEMGMHEPVVVRVEFHDHGAKTRMTLSDGPYPAPGAATPRPAGTPPSTSSRRSSPSRERYAVCTNTDEPALVQRLAGHGSRWRAGASAIDDQRLRAVRGPGAARPRADGEQAGGSSRTAGRPVPWTGRSRQVLHEGVRQPLGGGSTARFTKIV